MPASNLAYAAARNAAGNANLSSVVHQFLPLTPRVMLYYPPRVLHLPQQNGQRLLPSLRGMKPAAFAGRFRRRQTLFEAAS